MIITVASGKGGTGKTTFAVNMAYTLAAEGCAVTLLDCDVEEPNDHLFVKPAFDMESDIHVMKPVWDASACTACGRCAAACVYNAMAVIKDKVLIFDELCHACGACSHVCPMGALHEEPMSIGKVQADFGGGALRFAHGVLGIGQTLAPMVVKSVKAYIDPDGINILDASPGTSCPVVKALEHADVAILLTEPTPFGLNDLKLAVSMTLEMGIPTGIVVNRSDGSDRIIADWAEQVDVPIVGRIPFRRTYAETYSNGDILVEHHEELRHILLGIYDAIRALQGTAVPPAVAMDAMEISTAPAAPFTPGHATDYREVTIISGKGGTGKTTVAASFAVLATDHQILADNDVDAADLHLLLAPQIREKHPFIGGTRAHIDADVCTGCGACAAACHFDAIRAGGPPNAHTDTTYRIDPLACEGCGLCTRVCTVAAISSSEVVTGHWYVSGTDSGPMVHARLGIAEENSGRLVTQVRNRAGQLAVELAAERILGDGPPGTGCPVIASVSGADLALIVTEPTVSGVHDMERALSLTSHFGVPALVIINKADLNTQQAARIEAIAKRGGSRIIARIPFDRAVHDALMAGKTLIDHGPGAAADAVRQAWAEVLGALDHTNEKR